MPLVQHINKTSGNTGAVKEKEKKKKETGGAREGMKRDREGMKSKKKIKKGKKEKGKKMKKTKQKKKKKRCPASYTSSMHTRT